MCVWALIFTSTPALKAIDLARAVGHACVALEAAQKAGDRRTTADALMQLAELCQPRGLAAPSARLVGAAAALLETNGMPMNTHQCDVHAGLVAAMRETLGDEPFDQLWAEGHVMMTEQAISYAVV